MAAAAGSEEAASTSGDRFALVELPGVVSDTERALHSLGGLATISREHFGRRALQLRHRPQNELLRGVLAQRHLNELSSDGLQLVVRARRRRPTPADQPSSPVQASIIGQVAVTHRFGGMCDFQFLPFERVSAPSAAAEAERTSAADGSDDDATQQDEYKLLVDKLWPQDMVSALTWWDPPTPGNTDQHTPLYLPPMQFSRYIQPSPHLFSRNVETTEKKHLQKEVESIMGRSLRADRRGSTYCVDGGEAFPTGPREAAVVEADQRCRSDAAHLLINELFERRPMWTRLAIALQSRLDDNVLKVLLPKYAFYILSGPWGRLWCRFGYDPRRQRSSVQYQTVVVSFKNQPLIPERVRLRLSTPQQTSETAADNKIGLSEVDAAGRAARVQVARRAGRVRVRVGTRAADAPDVVLPVRRAAARRRAAVRRGRGRGGRDARLAGRRRARLGARRHQGRLRRHRRPHRRRRRRRRPTHGPGLIRCSNHMRCWLSSTPSVR